jgi:hypothetical protein
VSRRAAETEARDQADADEEGCDEEGCGGGGSRRRACHAVLHKVAWARLVVDDAHVLLHADPARLAPVAAPAPCAARAASANRPAGLVAGRSREAGVGAGGGGWVGGTRSGGGAAASGASGRGGSSALRSAAKDAALSPSEAKAEALGGLRASSRWCLLSAAKAPKLWRSREQLRNLVTAIGAPPGYSLVRLVPELVLELE